MTLDEVIWIAMAAYALHVLEEYVFDWATWVRLVLKLPVHWNHFYLTNAVVMVLGAMAAEIAPQMPVLALCFPALLAINAVFFHIAQVIRFKGRFSPGVMTATVLLLPAASLCYGVAYMSGLLTGRALLLSFIGGALLMAAPIGFLKLKGLPYFVQAQGNE